MLTSTLRKRFCRHEGWVKCFRLCCGKAKKQGLLDGKTVYVTTTVCEEDCDGVNLINFYKDSGIKPNFVFICEPSYNVITLGHNGKMQVRIRTQGISAHGSAPEKGVNAVYEMAEIITRVDELNKRLQKTEGKGTVVLPRSAPLPLL